MADTHALRAAVCRLQQCIERLEAAAAFLALKRHELAADDTISRHFLGSAQTDYSGALQRCSAALHELRELLSHLPPRQRIYWLRSVRVLSARLNELCDRKV